MCAGASAARGEEGHHCAAQKCQSLCLIRPIYLHAVRMRDLIVPGGDLGVLGPALRRLGSCSALVTPLCWTAWESPSVIVAAGAHTDFNKTLNMIPGLRALGQADTAFVFFLKRLQREGDLALAWALASAFALASSPSPWCRPRCHRWRA